MSKTQKEYKQETAEAICAICGSRQIIRKYNYNRNCKSHDGKYICQKCATKLYSESDEYTFTIGYILPDDIKKGRAIKKLKKENIALLDYVKTPRGLFPPRKDGRNCLKLKCLKCGAVWWGKPRVYIDKPGKCPVCTDVKMSRVVKTMHLKRKGNINE